MINQEKPSDFLGLQEQTPWAPLGKFWGPTSSTGISGPGVPGIPGAVSLRGQTSHSSPGPLQSHPAPKIQTQGSACDPARLLGWETVLGKLSLAKPAATSMCSQTRELREGRLSLCTMPADKAQHPDLQASRCVPTPVMAPGAPRRPCLGFFPQSHWLPSNLFSKPPRERSFQDANLVMSLPT